MATNLPLDSVCKPREKANGEKTALNSKEAATLLGIAVYEDSLIRHFTLDPADRLEWNFAAARRTSWAPHFTLLNAPTGRLLSENEQPLAAAVKYLTGQFGIDARLYELYARRVQTRFDHSHPIAHNLAQSKRRERTPAAGAGARWGWRGMLPPSR